MEQATDTASRDAAPKPGRDPATGLIVSPATAAWLARFAPEDRARICGAVKFIVGLAVGVRSA